MHEDLRGPESFLAGGKSPGGSNSECITTLWLNQDNTIGWVLGMWGRQTEVCFNLPWQSIFASLHLQTGKTITITEGFWDSRLKSSLHMKAGTQKTLIAWKNHGPYLLWNYCWGEWSMINLVSDSLQQFYCLSRDCKKYGILGSTQTLYSCWNSDVTCTVKYKQMQMSRQIHQRI